MMNSKIIIFFLFITIACSSPKKQTNELKKDESSQSVREFYDWYLNEAYGKISYTPDFKKIDEDKYVFDEHQFELFLSTVPNLSEEYIEQQINTLQQCNLNMLEIRWEDEPEPEFNIESCNYFWSDPWVGGQGEDITDYKIEEVKEKLIDNEEYKLVTVQILANEIKHVKSEVRLDSENKILDIELIW